jgi:hypothetical protein
MQYQDNTPYENPIEAIDYAIDILEATLAKSDNGLEPKYVDLYGLKYYLPYSLESTSVEGRYLLCNRIFKPLGHRDNIWVNYDEYPSLHIYLTDEQLKTSVVGNVANILWDGHYTPLNAVGEAYEYLTRLKRLLNILEGQN